MEPWGLEWNEKLFSMVSSVAVMASAWFVGKQVRVMREDYRKKNQKSEFGLAFQLTNYYVREIMPGINSTFYAFEQLGISKALEAVDSSKFCLFDKDELEELYPKEVLNKLENFSSMEKPNDVLIAAISLQSGVPVYALDRDLLNYIQLNSKDKDGFDRAKKIFFNSLDSKLSETIWHTLNKLEYFSMYFETNLAESDTAYCSLHQTFLSFVRSTYYFISYKNEKSSQKFYTHLIALYNRWSDKEFECQEMENAVREKARTVGCVAHKKIDD